MYILFSTISFTHSHYLHDTTTTTNCANQLYKSLSSKYGFLKSPIPAYRLFQWKTTPHPFFTYGPHNTVWETLHHTCDIIAEKPKHFVIPTHIIEQIQHMDMNNIALIQTHPIEIYMHKNVDTKNGTPSVLDTTHCRLTIAL